MSTPQFSTNSTQASPLEDVRGAFAPKPIGRLRWLWSATRRVDRIWYQLQNPYVAAAQQFVHRAFEDNEHIQLVATLIVAAERCLKAVHCLQRLECSFATFRRVWAIPSSEFPNFTRRKGVRYGLRAKVRRLAVLCVQMALECLQLAMTLLDAREAFAWDERRRRERVGHFVVDIARLCENIDFTCITLRGESDRLDRCFKRIGSPFRAQQFLYLLDRFDRLAGDL